MLNYGRIPEHMRDAAKLYIEHGIRPGNFLYAVLTNDLVGAFGAADEINQCAMFDWARWLHNECPMGSWGSRENVANWMAHGGMSNESPASSDHDAPAASVDTGQAAALSPPPPGPG